MSGWIAMGLARLSDRERLLLALLVVFVLPAAVIYLAVLPMQLRCCNKQALT